MYKPKKDSLMVSICNVYLLKYKIIIFFCEVASLIISISQDIG